MQNHIGEESEILAFLAVTGRALKTLVYHRYLKKIHPKQQTLSCLWRNPLSILSLKFVDPIYVAIT